MQQDAHEFLNYLLNTIADLLQEEKSQERQQNGKLVQNGGGGGGGGSAGSEGGGGGGGGEGEGGKETQQTWVHEIFQGTLTNETRCLNCEAVRAVFKYLSCFLFVCITLERISDLERLLLWLQVSSKDEDFLDLSVDVEQNTSITHCLR